MRVRGVENLRVCDLSTVPNNNFGNTAISVMMCIRKTVKNKDS